MLTINSITRGIVIDHIKAGLGIKIFNYLGLDKAEFTVALIMNAKSNKMGKKDIIKIQNELDIDFHVLGFIDPNVTIVKIDKGEIVEKLKLTLPERVENIIKCKNPSCITGIENGVTHIFYLADRAKGLYRCLYCDDLHKDEN